MQLVFVARVAGGKHFADRAAILVVQRFDDLVFLEAIGGDHLVFPGNALERQREGVFERRHFPAAGLNETAGGILIGKGDLALQGHRAAGARTHDEGGMPGRMQRLRAEVEGHLDMLGRLPGFAGHIGQAVQ